MAKPAARIAVIQAAFFLGVAAVLFQSADLQVVHGARWAAEARTQRTAHDTLPARRGALYDRNGVPLAITQEFYHVGVAPNEVADAAGTLRLLSRQLGVPLAPLQRDFRARRYLYFHGPFTATQLEPIRSLKGIHLTGAYQRAYPARELAAAVVGRLDPETGTGESGIERALDSVLTGQPGEAVFLKDRSGRKYESPSRLVREPVAGGDVWLTIDAGLQEIAERGLDDALHALGAEGGDVVFLDPMTGEVLAIASRQHAEGGGGSAGPSFFTTPYQPGSTAKLFTAAALLVHHKVDSTSAVSGHDGLYRMPVRGGRFFVIEDSHKEAGMVTLAQAIEVSSNIAMAQFAQRLTPVEQFETLRGFGFGSPTGIEFPAESRGVLQMPDRWLPDYSRASVAMGYEFSVTPIQLAAAYGAIANDGVLVTPTLVRQIRDASGHLVYEHQPEPVRRAVPPDVAARLRAFLRGAVGKGGTGGNAQLANYELAGKTGTARRFVNGRYASGEYTASFAAIFPADHPQLVVIVKIDKPSIGSYYAASTAAPTTRAMLEQALAARQVAIDRSQLAAPLDSAPVKVADSAEPAPAPPPVVFAWPDAGRDRTRADSLPVPDVRGAAVRQAVLTLHRRGFKVSLHGFGTVLRTDPAAGESAAPGSAISVWTD
jgi:cell division protein FtsI (penicillin-binding protein 3)